MALPAFLQRPLNIQAERFIQRLHRRTHQLPLALRAIKPARVLLIAPHMDDEMIGAGGALALHQAAGSVIKVAFVSDSSGDIPAATDANVRWDEAQKACSSIGIQDLQRLDFPDGRLLLHVPEISRTLARLIQEFKPDEIFCPFPGDNHQDHQASAAALRQALNLAPFKGEIWTYEVWSPLWPNFAVDISSVINKKFEAIRLYSSQLLHRHYHEAAIGLNRYRGLRVNVAYAETFYVCSTRTFQKLCKSVEFIL